MADQQEELRSRIESLSDNELIRMVDFDYNDYREEALAIAKNELKKRNIDSSGLEGIKENLTKEINNHYDYAGFWLRFFAYFIDKIILGISVFIISGIVLGLGKLVGIDEYAYIVYFIILLSLGWLYYALMECSSVQATIGKMLFGLIVTDMNGNRITFGRASARFFGKIISGLILDIGYIITGFTEKKQALHDIMSDCLVIKEKS